MKSSISVHSVSPLLDLIRWRNALISAGGVLLGAWWSGGSIGASVLLAALAAVALTAAANAWNDVADIDIDRVAHPNRPIPAGRLSADAARSVAWTAAGLSLVLASLARPELGALSAIVLVLMFAYSPWLKRRGLVGNVVVAVLASLPFLYGAWAAGEPGRGLVLVVIAAPLHLAREIAKDLEDAPADAMDRRTVPLTAGIRVARRLLIGAICLFFLALVPLSLRRPLLALAMIPAVFVAASAGRLAMRGRTGSPRLLKMAMLCAMAAFACIRA